MLSITSTFHPAALTIQNTRTCGFAFQVFLFSTPAASSVRITLNQAITPRTSVFRCLRRRRSHTYAVIQCECVQYGSHSTEALQSLMMSPKTARGPWHPTHPTHLEVVISTSAHPPWIIVVIVIVIIIVTVVICWSRPWRLRPGRRRSLGCRGQWWSVFGG